MRRQPREDSHGASPLPSGFDEPDELTPLVSRRPVLKRLRKLILALGAVKSTSLVVLLVSLASLLITLVVNALFPPPPDMVTLTIALSLGIPLAIAPPATWLVVLLMLEAESARRMAERLAMTDPLTQTCNRRHFFRVGEQVMARAPDGAQTVSVLLLDIDHFKAVNDHHGHAFGDLVLSQVAATCKASLRKGDILARFGGEEFVVLLPATGLAGARVLAEQLRAAVEQLSTPALRGQVVRPTVSIGVAASRTGACSLDELLLQADHAMYLAKRNGRNRVVNDSAAA